MSYTQPDIAGDQLPAQNSRNVVGARRIDRTVRPTIAFIAFEYPNVFSHQTKSGVLPSADRFAQRRNICRPRRVDLETSGMAAAERRRRCQTGRLEGIQSLGYHSVVPRKIVRHDHVALALVFTPGAKCGTQPIHMPFRFVARRQSACGAKGHRFESCRVQRIAGKAHADAENCLSRTGMRFRGMTFSSRTACCQVVSNGERGTEAIYPHHRHAEPFHITTPCSTAKCLERRHRQPRSSRPFSSSTSDARSARRSPRGVLRSCDVRS